MTYFHCRFIDFWYKWDTLPHSLVLDSEQGGLVPLTLRIEDFLIASSYINCFAYLPTQTISETMRDFGAKVSFRSTVLLLSMHPHKAVGRLGCALVFVLLRPRIQIPRYTFSKHV